MWSAAQLSDTRVWAHAACVQVNMMDRMDAAGQCVGDACSHKSSNLSLSIRPAECVRVSSGHLFISHCPIVHPCPLLLLIMKNLFMRKSPVRNTTRQGEKEEGDVEGRGENGGRGLNKRFLFSQLVLLHWKMNGSINSHKQFAEK